ncbi:hypothetical protein FYC62_15745 [Pedobacter aquae]|uniref:Surface antigen-like protein n=1 Tax=Pedobacter aquae TaxID=2605747 RepID=A0A5C0VN32_9SPHI|nr:hypothetical protein [Pedobacter aquae]QEK52961.1 hypothetical protein FYC62_15745 [Pedobacter aquae]
MKKILLLFLLGLSLNGFSQKKLIDKFFSPDTNRHNSFLPVPVIAYTQEAGFEFGGAGLYSFYLDKTDSLIRPSQLYGLAYTSTKGQSQVSIRSDLWSRGNKWHHLYDARFYNLPFNFYGVGDATLRSNEDKLIQRRFRLNAEVERQLAKSYYPGLGVEFESQSFRDVELGGFYNNTPFFDKDGGNFILFKITQLIDTRNTNIYTTKGFFTRLRYGYAPDFFKQQQFEGTLFTLDSRYFYTPHKKFTIAAQGFMEAVSSKREIPFYMLRQMGNDQIMRGYYMGRYRDENYAAIQAEIRFRPVDRFGLVAFGGTGTVYAKNNFSVNRLKPNYGIGGRFFFDLDKSLALRVDYGFGEKPLGEKRNSGLYISLGESF